jgi:hypothetical protein
MVKTYLVTTQHDGGADYSAATDYEEKKER